VYILSIRYKLQLFGMLIIVGLLYLFCVSASYVGNSDFSFEDIRVLDFLPRKCQCQYWAMFFQSNKT